MSITLPTSPTTPVSGITAYRWMIHGWPKTGKTTLASMFPAPLFIATEPGCKAMSVWSVVPESWKDISDIVEMLNEEEHHYETVVFDTMERTYDMLYKTVAKDRGVADISKMKYGAGYSEANKRLVALLDALAAIPLCVVLISHSTIEKDESGIIEVERAVPSLSASARRTCTGWADQILFTRTENIPIESEESASLFDGEAPTETIHQVICRARPGCEAGGRLRYLPSHIDMVPGPLEGWATFEAAVNASCERQLAELQPQGT